LITTLSTNGFLIEPVFYWPEERTEIHESAIEPGFLAKLPRLAANPSATAHVAHLRTRIVEIFSRFGSAHFQVGRTYPLLPTRSSEMASLLKEAKRALDPDRIMNPGALGL
jgi:hypothetical protein